MAKILEIAGKNIQFIEANIEYFLTELDGLIQNIQAVLSDRQDNGAEMTGSDLEYLR